MKKIVTYELEHDEQVVLNMLATARKKLTNAQMDWESAIMVCVEKGLPVRLIGEYAGCSGAHVSRLAQRHRDRWEVPQAPQEQETEAQ